MRRGPLGLRRWCVDAGATLKARRVAPHHSAPRPTPATQRRSAKRFAGRFAQKRKNASERNTKRPEARFLSKGSARGTKAANQSAGSLLRRRHAPWPAPGACGGGSFFHRGRIARVKPARAEPRPFRLGPSLPLPTKTVAPGAKNRGAQRARRRPARRAGTIPLLISQSPNQSHAAGPRQRSATRRFNADAAAASKVANEGDGAGLAVFD